MIATGKQEIDVAIAAPLGPKQGINIISPRALTIQLIKITIVLDIKQIKYPKIEAYSKKDYLKTSPTKGLLTLCHQNKTFQIYWKFYFWRYSYSNYY